MEVEEFDEKYRRRFEKLATTNLADALDKVGIRGAVIGIRPMYECSKIIGRAVTIKITAAGMAKSKYHLGVRDIDACKDFGFPVYARGTVPITARGRVMEESFNEGIRIGDVQVRPGDILAADISGVVVIPVEKLDEVLEAAEQVFQKETAMVEELRKGVPILEVDQKYGYEAMLKK